MSDNTMVTFKQWMFFILMVGVGSLLCYFPFHYMLLKWSVVGDEALKPFFTNMILNLHEYHNFVQVHIPSFLPVQNLKGSEGGMVSIFLVSMTPIFNLLPISLIPIPFLWYWAKVYQSSTGNLSEFKRPMRFIPITSIVLIELFLWLPLVFFLAYCLAEVLIIFLLMLAFSVSYFLLPVFYITMLLLKPVTKDLFKDAGLHHIQIGTMIDNVKNIVGELLAIHNALDSTYSVIVSDISEDDLAWHSFGEDNSESIEQYTFAALEQVRLLAQIRDSEVEERYFDQEIHQAFKPIHDILAIIEDCIARMENALDSSEMYISKGKMESNMGMIKGLFKEELEQFKNESPQHNDDESEEEVGFGSKIFRFFFGAPHAEEEVSKDEIEK